LPQAPGLFFGLGLSTAWLTLTPDRQIGEPALDFSSPPDDGVAAQTSNRH
jgi:hypothetical protein